MPTNTQKAQIAPNRSQLAAHHQALATARAEYQDAVAQHRRLRSFVDLEANAQAKLDAIKHRNAKLLAEQISSADSPRTATVDHREQGNAEDLMARAKREADAARACEPALIERMAQFSRHIDALQQQTSLLAANIMLGDAAGLAAEINSEARKLRTKYAKLWGLRRHVGDTPAIRKRLDDLPVPIHPDNVAPDPGEVTTAAANWHGYAVRLAADPNAEFKE
jgi:hypothetical protein